MHYFALFNWFIPLFIFNKNILHLVVTKHSQGFLFVLDSAVYLFLLQWYVLKNLENIQFLQLNAFRVLEFSFWRLSVDLLAVEENILDVSSDMFFGERCFILKFRNKLVSNLYVLQEFGVLSSFSKDRGGVFEVVCEFEQHF